MPSVWRLARLCPDSRAHNEEIMALRSLNPSSVPCSRLQDDCSGPSLSRKQPLDGMRSKAGRGIAMLHDHRADRVIGQPCGARIIDARSDFFDPLAVSGSREPCRETRTARPARPGWSCFRWERRKQRPQLSWLQASSRSVSLHQ